MKTLKRMKSMKSLRFGTPTAARGASTTTTPSIDDTGNGMRARVLNHTNLHAREEGHHERGGMNDYSGALQEHPVREGRHTVPGTVGEGITMSTPSPHEIQYASRVHFLSLLALGIL